MTDERNPRAARARGGVPDETPAPVISDAITEEPPLPAGLEEYAEGEGDGLWQVGVWFFGIVFVVAASLWLTTYSLSQATSREAALPALERGLVALSEIDSLIAIHKDELRAEAESGAALSVPGFPLAAEVPGDVALGADGDLDEVALRAAVLARGADRLYTEGASAFTPDDAETTVAPPRLSTRGFVRSTFSWLTDARHDDIERFVLPLAALMLAAGAGVVWLSSGFGRLIRIGLLAALAAGPVLAVALTARLGFVVVAESDVVAQEFEEIARALAGAPVRNALVFAGAGLAIAVPAVILHALFERSVRRRFASARR